MYRLLFTICIWYSSVPFLWQQMLTNDLLPVSRPLFIEEYGLRLLLEREGVGVELSRQSYEEGDWAGAVQEAWAKGKEAKWRKRTEGAAGVGLTKREEDGVQLARRIVNWTEEWWAYQD